MGRDGMGSGGGGGCEVYCVSCFMGLGLQIKFLLFLFV